MDILSRIAIHSEWEKYFLYKKEQGNLARKDEDDIKSFLNQVFEGIPENDLKMHYTILKYYASLK